MDSGGTSEGAEREAVVEGAGIDSEEGKGAAFPPTEPAGLLGANAAKMSEKMLPAFELLLSAVGPSPPLPSP
jgi:hypothetical protein